MTIREALTQGVARLRNAGIENPGLDTALFLAFILKTNKEKIILRDAEALREDAAADFAGLLDRRIAGECTAYILGRKEFRGLDFIVTPDVLVPRPDTETLVEAVLTIGKDQELTVLDLCTGSGAVAIALKHELPSLEVYASDISVKTLAVARENARQLLGSDGAIHFLESDLFVSIPKTRFSLITANPPYVASGEIAALAREVRGEPLLALDGGEDGLDLVRRIIDGAPSYLLPGGRLLMEADPRQMAGITLILEKKGYRDIRIYQDLSGQDRVIDGIAGCDVQ
ncbi:peptide chain release factor N(5)-glutamine methyltransferase [Treponema primitia]|uniref:peptide chain release factor N(5)-glutamine methyltransferase n=1 Tax=Treponema primitia TaxID=88058 RepID=UPI00025555D6|nr:peptide chain release factor N(5)-glutamine methyltransferase [Treponema primitia]